MKYTQERLIHTLKYIVDLLITKDYKGLETSSKGKHLTAEEIEGAVHEYDGTLVTPPERSYINIDSIEIMNSRPRSWSVVYPLWNKDGESDLSLEVTAIESGEEIMDIEIDNIHVR